MENPRGTSLEQKGAFLPSIFLLTLSAGLSFLSLGVCVTSGPFLVLQAGCPGGKRGPERVPRASGLWIPWPGGLRPWNTWHFGGKCSPVCAQPLTCRSHRPTPMHTLPCLLCRYTCPFTHTCPATGYMSHNLHLSCLKLSSTHCHRHLHDTAGSLLCDSSGPSVPCPLSGLRT